MENHIRKDCRKKTPEQSKRFLEILRKHLAVFSQVYRQPIGELAAMAYGEDLAELSAEELDAACREARKTSEFLPTSATILKAAQQIKTNRQQQVFLGPGMIDWEALETPEEKQDRLERKASAEKLLRVVAEKKSA
jgi:ribosomal protein L29